MTLFSNQEVNNGKEPVQGGFSLLYDRSKRSVCVEYYENYKLSVVCTDEHSVRYVLSRRHHVATTSGTMQQLPSLS